MGDRLWLGRANADGEWETGQAPPTVAELAVHYGVAKATVTRTLRMLAYEGLITVVPAG